MPTKKIRAFRGLRDYYMSWGMQHVRNGTALAVIGRLTNAAKEGILSNMETPIAINVARKVDGTLEVFMITDNGWLFKSDTGISGWAPATNFSVDSDYNDEIINMITDQNDTLLLMNDSHIGLLEGDKDWTGGDWSKDKYAFSISTSTNFHPAALVQQYVVIGNDNIIARLDTTSGTYEVGDFTAAALTMPAGYVASAIAQKGEDYKRAIIAFNRNKTGAIVTWDCVSSSPDSIVPVGEEVHALVTAEDNRTYAIIGNGVLYDVSAFPIVPVFTPPDNEARLTINDFKNFSANALGTSRRKIYMGYSGGSAFNRHKAGLWVYNIDTRNTIPLCPLNSDDQIESSIKVIKTVDLASGYRILIGAEDAASVGRIDYLNDNPLINGSFYISPIIRAKHESSLRGIKFNVSQYLPGDETNDLNIAITASYFNFKKRLWAKGVEDGTAPAANKIALDNSTTPNKPLVGEEITILEGANAGDIRRITAVDLASDPNIYTLDSAMGAATANTLQMNINPFIKLNTTATTITEGGEVWIECKDKPLFKELLIKIQLQITTGGIPVISDLDVIYDHAPQPR